MLPTILIVIAVVVVLFLVVVALRPAELSVTRSATIAAPAAILFAQVNDLRKWEPWNPWGKLDPAMKLSYEGPAAGVGAKYAWVGNSKVGEGRMTITESRANELIRFDLEFFKPMAGTNVTTFTFKAEGSQTTVTWSMKGKNCFMARAVGLVINMEKMIGGQFEQGLANLKSVVAGAAVK